MADTLGSVAVIISSFLIDWYGLYIADPICSLILSVLILSSVAPLLKNSASVLILSVPSRLKDGAKDAISKVSELPFFQFLVNALFVSVNEYIIAS